MQGVWCEVRDIHIVVFIMLLTTSVWSTLWSYIIDLADVFFVTRDLLYLVI